MHSLHAPRAAIGFMLASAMFIAASTLCAKLIGTETLGPALHPLQVTFGRFAFAWIAIGTAVAILRPTFTGPAWRLHLARTSCGWAGVTLMFAAVALIPLSDATAISFLNPIFAMLLAIAFLGERVGPWRWLSVVLALIGALVLLRPGPGTFQAAALLALLAAMIMGIEITIIKRLSGHEGPLQILFVNNSLGIAIATVAVIPVWTSPSSAQWYGMAAVGFTMAAAQACFVNAMRRADASFVAPFAYATLIFASLFDAAVYGVIPDGVSIAGATLIVAGAALLAWRETRAQGLSR